MLRIDLGFVDDVLAGRNTLAVVAEVAGETPRVMARAMASVTAGMAADMVRYAAMLERFDD